MTDENETVEDFLYGKITALSKACQTCNKMFLQRIPTDVECVKCYTCRLSELFSIRLTKAYDFDDYIV